MAELESAGLSLEPVAGWGRHPVERGAVARPERLLLPPGGRPVLPRGLGRSYGDAAVPAAPGALVLETARADRVVAFDRERGTLTCEAGLSLAEILRVFLPRGWFPPVTPGTKFVTVGGCVACDVHGKNHHRDGSFGRFVDRLVLQVADGSVVECGPARERELFLATVGGMGLTGLITEVTLRLQPVESAWMVVETEPVPGLGAMLDGLRDAGKDWPYTVGWIDCLARGAALGRGILMRGRHASRAEAPAVPPPEPRRLAVPLDAPEWLLSPILMRGFNAAYYWKHAWWSHARRTRADLAARRGPCPATASSTRSMRSAAGTACTAGAASSSTSAWCRAPRARRPSRSCWSGSLRREQLPSSPSSRTAGRSPTPTCPFLSRARRWRSTCRTGGRAPRPWSTS